MIFIYTVLSCISYYIFSLLITLKFFIVNKHYVLEYTTRGYYGRFSLGVDCKKILFSMYSYYFLDAFCISEAKEELKKYFTEKEIKSKILEVFELRYFKYCIHRSYLGLYSIFLLPIYLMLGLPYYICKSIVLYLIKVQNKTIDKFIEPLKIENTEDLLIPVYPENDNKSSKN